MFIVSSPRRVKIEWLSASRKLQRSSHDCCEIRLSPGTREERAEVFGVIGQHKRKGGELPFGNCCELLSSRKTLETSNCQAQKNLFPELAARRTESDKRLGTAGDGVAAHVFTTNTEKSETAPVESIARSLGFV